MIRIVCEEVLETVTGQPLPSTFRTFDVEHPALEAFLRQPGNVRAVVGAEVEHARPPLRPVA